MALIVITVILHIAEIILKLATISDTDLATSIGIFLAILVHVSALILIFIKKKKPYRLVEGIYGSIGIAINLILFLRDLTYTGHNWSYIFSIIEFSWFLFMCIMCCFDTKVSAYFDKPKQIKTTSPQESTESNSSSTVLNNNNETMNSQTNKIKSQSDINKIFEQALNMRNLNDGDPLYQYEHISLRKLFFDLGPQFVNSILLDNDFLYSLYVKQCEAQRQYVKYSKDHFNTTAHKGKDGKIVLRLTPPNPYRAPLCYQIFMVVDENGNPVSYYTLEKDISSNQGTLCGWGKEDTHYNYGNHESNDNNCGFIEKDLDISSASSINDLVIQAKQNDVTNNNEAQKKEETNNDVIETTTNNQTEQKKDIILFCRKCGAKLNVNSAFCHKCGNKIDR